MQVWPSISYLWAKEYDAKHNIPLVMVCHTCVGSLKIDYIHATVHIFMCTCTYISIYMYAYTLLSVYTNTFMIVYTFIWTCIYISTPVCMSMRGYTMHIYFLINILFHLMKEKRIYYKNNTGLTQVDQVYSGIFLTRSLKV
jgi:hypothetical protein